MRDDVGHVRAAVAAVDHGQLDHAALAAAAARPRPRRRAGAPRASSRRRGGRAKLSIRLFMPGTASRTSGQRLRPRAPAPRCAAGRQRQSSPGASNSSALVPEQADRRASSALMRALLLLQPALEMVDVDAAGGEARVLRRSRGAAAGWWRCLRPASRRAPARMRASASSRVAPCTISLAIIES